MAVWQIQLLGGLRRTHDNCVIAEDKPHGLRDAYMADSDGYVWVPDVVARL